MGSILDALDAFMLRTGLLLALLAGLAQSQTDFYVDASHPGCPGSGTPADPFCTVQAGITAASHGDRVLVAPGHYLEKIDYQGKAIQVVSLAGAAVTILDGQQSGSVVTFQSGEGRASVLEGFTITNGSSSGGGGILCQQSSPTIRYNTITANRGQQDGGAIYCNDSTARFVGNAITYNEVGSEGGALKCVFGAVELTGNLIANNRSGWLAGGVSNSLGTPILTNNTIVGNEAAIDGGGFWTSTGGTVTNCILWGNQPNQIVGSPSVTYSDVEGGAPGNGNIAADPLFLDPASGDYRLSCASPAVDAGTAGTSVALPPLDRSGLDHRVIGTVDMGADEVGVLWELTGPLSVGGPPVSFVARAAASHPTPNLGEVFISLGDGTAAGGLPVPLSGGRRMALDADALFGLWLRLPTPLRRVILSGCSGATTAPFSLSSQAPLGVEVFWAGVALDLSSSSVTSISATCSATTR